MEVKVVDFNGKIPKERLNLIQYSQLNQIIVCTFDVKHLANQRQGTQYKERAEVAGSTMRFKTKGTNRLPRVEKNPLFKEKGEQFWTKTKKLFI
jgi:hypothetical protein